MLADIAPYVAVAAMAAAVALAGVALWLARRLSDLDKRQSAVLGPRERRDIVAFVLELEEQVDNLREAVTILTEEVEAYRHDLDAALSNIAVVRFDAFPDTGGEQSASIALLDNYRSGIVVSIIASRETARLYVKFLDHGLPDRKLAPEEQAAVQRAVPAPLPRGELSRSPVSTFSRDVRRAIEETRRGAAGTGDAEAGGAHGVAADEAPGGASGESPAADPDEGRPAPGPTPAAEADAEAHAPATDETWSWEVSPVAPRQSSEEWTDEWRRDAAPDDEELSAGGPDDDPLTRPDTDRTGPDDGPDGRVPDREAASDSDDAPGRGSPAAGSAPADETALQNGVFDEDTGVAERRAGHAVPDGTGVPESAVDDPSAPVTEGPDGPSASATEGSDGPGMPADGIPDGPDGPAEEGSASRPPKDRQAHDDWLGGDELDF